MRPRGTIQLCSGVSDFLYALNCLQILIITGLKIHNSRTYSATITSPLRISHGILDPSTNSNGLIELHITIGKRSDYVISRFDEDKDLVQHSLNIVLSYGDEITLYLRCKGSNACVHLCGYYLRSGPAAVHAVTWSEEALENKQVNIIIHY